MLQLPEGTLTLDRKVGVFAALSNRHVGSQLLLLHSPALQSGERLIHAEDVLREQATFAAASGLHDLKCTSTDSVWLTLG